MRLVLVTALAGCLAGAAALPAAAATSDERTGEADARGGTTVVWPSYGPPQFERRRVARAVISDTEEEYEARTTQRRYQSRTVDRPRQTKRRATRAAKRATRHQEAARRSARRAAHRDGRRSAQRFGYRTEQRRVREARRADRRRTVARHGSFEGREIHGIASYYWQGQRVATGARFNPEGLTAAHRSLPFGTRVRVTHLGNGRSVNVVINDRGPFIAGRIIDLARGAARVIGMTGQGLARVRVTVLGR
jgi:rare lipoprotein A